MKLEVGFPNFNLRIVHKAMAEVSEHHTYTKAWLLCITDGGANPLMDWKAVARVFFGVFTMVAVVTWSVTSPTAGCSVVKCSCIHCSCSERRCSCGVVELVLSSCRPCICGSVTSEV